MQRRTIFKYVLSAEPRQTIMMPRGATIISVGVQHKNIVVWAIVSKEQDEVEHLIICLMTGDNTPAHMEQYKFVGTVTVPDGIVVHVFDGGE